ncbi:MAG: hypothetical protein IKA62_02165 [Clostridia bacterium]|nr:hypothetical protein [Clostridia bacterium]
MKRIKVKKVISVIISIILVLSSMVILVSAEECSHSDTEVRYRPNSAGSGHYVDIYCSDCGSFISGSPLTSCVNTKAIYKSNGIGSHSIEIYCSDCGAWMSDSPLMSCSGDNGICKDCGGHAHNFNIKNPSDEYLAIPGTCTIPQRHFYLCSCGEVGTEMYISGSGAHIFTQGICELCGTPCTHFDEKNESTIDEYGYCTFCNSHSEHKYVVKDTSLKYRAYAAVCNKPAEYFYTCKCGDVGSSTFIFGTAIGHSWNSDGICSVCGYNKYSSDSPDETDTDSVPDNNETESGSSSDSKNEAESESDPKSEVEELLDNFVGSLYGILMGVAFLCISGIAIIFFQRKNKK